MIPNVVRTGLIGYGLAGKVFHAPFIEADPAFSLDAIVTSDPVRRGGAAADHPRAAVFASFDDLMRASADFDLVVLATPPHLHFDQARAALEAGLAVIVDKPFVLTSREGERLIETAEACDRPLMVFQNRRWDGDFLTVKSLIEADVFGSVFQFESNFEHWDPKGGGGWKEFTTPEQGGGVTYDLGSHLIDQALQLFGPVVSIRADLRTVRPGTRNDDVSVVDLVHECGVNSQLRMNRVAAQPAHRFRVLGTENAFVSFGLDGQEPALAAGVRPTDPSFGETPESGWGTLGVRGGSQPPRAVPMIRGDYRGFYSAAAAAVQGRGPLPVDPRSSLAVTHILEEIRLVAGRA